jgi:hypothetical protein
MQTKKILCSYLKKSRTWFLFWDQAVLSKTVLSNFRPKKSNKWIGDHMVSLFCLFIAFLTWPNLTCFSRPLSLFFYHLWGSQQIFERTVFERTTYPAYFNKTFGLFVLVLFERTTYPAYFNKTFGLFVHKSKSK